MPKNRLLLAPVLLLAIIGISGCHSAASWSGTWLLDLSRGGVPGPTFTVAAMPNGFYEVAGGSPAYRFACDGKQHSTPGNYALSCTETASTMERISYLDGKLFRKGLWTLSENDTVLTITVEASTDGKSPAGESRYIRLKSPFGSKGFAGSWQDEHPLDQQPKTLILALNRQTMHMAFKDQNRFIDLPRTGQDAVMQGPHVPSDASMRIASHDWQTFVLESRRHGSVTSVISLRLSLDGRTLVERFGPPNSAAHATLVYHKQ